MADRPYILIDVDGVLNLCEASAEERERLIQDEGWSRHEVTVYGQAGYILVNSAHGQWLQELAQETGAELAWASGWMNEANTCISPLLGLPQLPVAPSWRGRKAKWAVEWTRGHPFVWFEDDRDECATAGYFARDGKQQHLMIRVDPDTGLTREHIFRAREWLLTL
jgi:hypothetical protein